jgi:hypothetical protein
MSAVAVTVVREMRLLTERLWRLVRLSRAGSLLGDSLLEATPALLTVAGDALASAAV